MITCKVIEDLLPLYADEICSDDSRIIVEHHVAECNECREKLDTMKILFEADKTQQIELENIKPFKLLYKRYIRLGIITLLICLAFLIPTALFGMMIVNEETDQGYSISTLMTEVKLYKFSRMIKKGEYREFLDNVMLQNQAEYTSEEISALKDIYAEDLKNYFEKYPIKRIWIDANNGKCTFGGIVFELETDLVPSNIETMRYLYFNCDQFAENMQLGDTDLMFFKDNISTYEKGETAYEIKKGFPETIPVSKKQVQSYFDRIKEEHYEHIAYNFWNSEKKNAENNNNFEQIGEYTKETAILTENLFTDYTYVSCETGDIIYMYNEIWRNCDRYFSQYTTLTIKDNNGTEFTVSFDLPIIYGRFYYTFQNITYSTNTPEDFKIRFEEIFA